MKSSFFYGVLEVFLRPKANDIAVKKKKTKKLRGELNPVFISAPRMKKEPMTRPRIMK